MAQVRRLYWERAARAKELRAEGKKIVGYLCCYPPVEIITAAGMVPYRITGTLEPVTDADAYLETLMCPYVRSCFDIAIKGGYGFLDGVVWPHTCDNIQKTYDIWRHYVPHSFFHYLDVPHMTDPSSFEFFEEELAVFKGDLEEYSGVKVSDERLEAAIAAHNENRALLRELSRLRQQDPPIISGAEMTQVVIAATTIPVDEANGLLRGVIEEVAARKDGPPQRPARLLVYGCEIDDEAFIKLVEDSGANVVIDDLCIGTRHYWHDVAGNGNPMKRLAQRYLGKLVCPRTYWRPLGSHREDLDRRLGYLREYARDFRVNGAILYIIRYCDTHEFDAPDVRDYLQEAGIAVLHLEDDYSLTSIGGFKTRIQAFLEMIS